MLYTGVPVLDTLYPCGRGHRYLIVGPRSVTLRIAHSRTWHDLCARICAGGLASALLRKPWLLRSTRHGSACWDSRPCIVCLWLSRSRARSCSTSSASCARRMHWSGRPSWQRRVRDWLPLPCGGASCLLPLPHSARHAADMAAGTHVVAPSVGCAVARRLRDAGNDVLLVLDDLGAHASALEALEGSARMALPTAAMQQAAVLEQAAQLAPHRGQHPGGTAGGELAPNAGSHSAAGSLTVVALADAASPDQLAKEGQLSMADEAVTLRAPKSLKRPLPAVDLRSVPWRTHAAFQPATLRVLSQRVRRHLVRAVDITSRAKLAAQYGVLDEDGVEDVVEDMGAIERLLFARGPDSSAVSPTHLLLLLHAADSGLAPLVRPGSELEFAGAVLSRLHERFPELLRAWEESFQCSAPLLSQQVLARVWSEMWTVSKAQGSTGVRRPAMPFEWTARRGSR